MEDVQSAATIYREYGEEMIGHDVTDSPDVRDRSMFLPREPYCTDGGARVPPGPLSRRRFLIVLGLLPLGFHRPVQDELFRGVSSKRAMFSRKITLSTRLERSA